jgi:hypothetical protein
MTDEQILEYIPRIAAVEDQVEESLREWVGRLRDRGVTWERIGATLGMTRQSAWGRFSGEFKADRVSDPALVEARRRRPGAGLRCPPVASIGR